MIHLVSAFRNSAAKLPAYMAMVLAAQRVAYAHGEDIIPFVVWGDSTDHTDKILQSWQMPRNYFQYNHGGPQFGSTEDPARMTALSGLLNHTLDELTDRRPLKMEDTVIWMEGDLFWDPFLPLQLQRYLNHPEVDVVAPMTFAGDAHYDTWGCRSLDGTRCGPFAPWGLGTDMHTLVEMSSVGSCVAMTGDVAQATRVRNNQALVGWCEDARAHGRRIWLARDLRVQHQFNLKERFNVA